MLLFHGQPQAAVTGGQGFISQFCHFCTWQNKYVLKAQPLTYFKTCPDSLFTYCVLLCLSQILSGVILEVLGEAFSDVVTPEVAAAWTKLLANMCCGVTAVYEEVGWNKLSSSTE